MPHEIKFYPVGNGDCSQIVLQNRRRVLFDYRHLKKTEDGEGPEINLKKELKEELDAAGRDYFDVFAVSHGDLDHIQGSTEFFWLDHSKAHQGEDRIKIKTLWVAAAMIIEELPASEKGSELWLLRQEARHRLIEGKGVRVFSRPGKLENWLKQHNLTLEQRKGCITDAGQLAKEFTLENDEVEFFCHSPFAKHTDDNDGVELRNGAALIFNIRFKGDPEPIDFLQIGDSEWDVLEDIVSITKKKGNNDRLKWDLYNLPHHCSYLALSDEKGKTETEPKPGVKELLLEGKEYAYMVSSSDPIVDEESVLPPHFQAKNAYKRHLSKINGQKLLVTMEEPNKRRPRPIVFDVRHSGLTLQGAATAGITSLTSRQTTRAG